MGLLDKVLVRIPGISARKVAFLRLPTDSPLIDELRAFLLAAGDAVDLPRVEQPTFDNQQLVEVRQATRANFKEFFGSWTRTKMIVVTAIRRKVNRAGIIRVLGIDVVGVHQVLHPGRGKPSIFERIGVEADGTISYQIRSDLPGRNQFIHLCQHIADLHPALWAYAKILDTECLSKVVSDDEEIRGYPNAYAGSGSLQPRLR
jgi:hypothetical protein